MAMTIRKSPVPILNVVAETLSFPQGETREVRDLRRITVRRMSRMQRHRPQWPARTRQSPRIPLRQRGEQLPVSRVLVSRASVNLGV
jgi:hypothetical protein